MLKQSLGLARASALAVCLVVAACEDQGRGRGTGEPAPGAEGLIGAPAATAAYNIVDLGDLGGSQSIAWGTNDVGQVVGYAVLPDRSAEHAFLWQNGVMTDLGTLGGSDSYAIDVNDVGQVAGYSYLPGNSSIHAFLLQSGVMTDLGTLGGSQSVAGGINDIGQVAGYSDLPGNSSTHAFLWQDGVMTDLGTLGGRWSYAWSINAAGQVVGGSYLPDSSAFHAFLWQNGVMTDLGTLGGTASYARGVNVAGQVVGDSAIPGHPLEHAFLWQNGVMTDLGTLGGSQSSAWAINDVGQVVGWSDLPGNSSVHAFLWQNGVMTDLSVPGDVFGVARDINNLGQISGDSLALRHGVLWTPADSPPANHPPVAVCQDITLAADEICGATASIDNGSYDPDGDLVSCSQSPGPVYGVGNTVVTLVCTDSQGLSGSCTGTVTVQDTAPPQVFVGPVAQLWPPDHTMRSFRLSDCASAADNCAGSVDIDARGTITSIFSDEPEDANGNGDGNTLGDIVITDNSSFSIRSERQGQGNGRVYGVNFVVTDGYGNPQTATCRFAVPHDQSNSSPVDDGAGSGYTVTVASSSVAVTPRRP